MTFHGLRANIKTLRNLKQKEREAMGYNTLAYLVLFLPVVLLIYHLVPSRLRKYVLLASGYVFFYICGKWLVLYMFGTALFIHHIGMWEDVLKKRCETEISGLERKEQTRIRAQYKKTEKTLLIFGITVLLGVLGYLKYSNFFEENLNLLAASMGKAPFFVIVKNAIPIGISFYTLQAIGYITDVYWEKLTAEYNLGKLMLFLCFFPQIMEGPISLYQQTADQLWNCKGLTADNLSQGAIRIFWGLFKKLVIADRLNVMVKVVFDTDPEVHGIVTIVAAVAYTVQLYMEFSGVIDIVIGSGKMFGIILPENFRQPFLSQSAEEFWRRWHITLGVWFKTYIFYPISISGTVKKWNKFARKHKLSKHITRSVLSALCLFPVWLANGLWHGPKWSYIFFGMYYFVIIMADILITPVRNKVLEKLHINEKARGYVIFRILKTWIIIFIGELFFRAETLTRGLQMFGAIFTKFDAGSLWNSIYWNVELRVVDYIAVIAGTVIVFVIDYLKEKDRISIEKIASFRTPVRWAIYYLLIFGVIIFGAYGARYQAVDLIYAGF